ncbi:hypothetical protein BHM03_00049669, partial [Ensete ventricosum]
DCASSSIEVRVESAYTTNRIGRISFQLKEKDLNTNQKLCESTIYSAGDSNRVARVIRYLSALVGWLPLGISKSLIGIGLSLVG